ncbi:MAG: ribbon-helix-helix domain-containing protein [Patescibacteria group bacterium]
MSNNSRAINITLPSDLVKEIDKAAKGEYASRSDFIRESVVRRLKNQRIVDEWGDEGNWETVVDFREINPEGVPLDEVITALEKLDKTDEQNRKATPKARS